jgi:site-specific DNA recombinase
MVHMTTAAVYARYSSDLQRPTSIEDQVRLCREAAPRFDCQVLDAYIFSDSEISGAVSERPGYAHLLDAARTGQFGAILVESQDRLWRDQAEMHAALKRLAFWGIRVIAVTTGTNLTDRTGKVLASIMGLKDELFLQDLKDKTRRGMMGQVRRGLSVGGRAFGYRSEPVRDANGQVTGYHRVIDPEEAAVVRRIFELYDAGYSPKTIAHILNDERVRPPRPARGRRVMGWTWSTIAGSPKKAIGILNNPLYVGRIAWNRSEKVRDPDTGRRIMRTRPQSEWIWTDAPDLRIIPQALWESVQARRQGRRREARGNVRGRRATALLSGLLECGTCGSHYVLNTPRYYGCTAHRDRGPAICANGRLVRRDRFEELILRLVFEEVFSPEAVAHVTRRVNEALERLTATPDEVRQRRERELSQASWELKNVREAIRQGIVTPTTKTLLEECEQRVAECEAALRAAAPRQKKVTALPSLVEDYLRDLRTTLDTDRDRARSLLAKLIGPITLRPDGGRLVGEVRGNLPALLDVEFAKSGAGRGI